MTQLKLSPSKTVWHCIVFAAVVFTALEAPYSFTFRTRLHTWQIWIDALLSLIFILDLIFFLKTRKIASSTHVKKNAHMVKRERVHILVDILCSIPFDVLAHVLDMAGLQIFRLVRLFRLVRITRIFSFVGSLTVVPNWFKALMAAVGSIMAINFIACGWILIYPNPGVLSDKEYFIHSLYWAVTTLTTVGYGDITPSTSGGKLYTMAIMILGVGVYGIVIGKVSQILAEANRYKEQTREKIQDLTNFMRHYNVPMKIQGSALNYYNHLLTKRMSDNDHHIIGELPPSLQEEMRTYMNVKLIGNLSIFDECSTHCLKEVAKNLEQKYYSPGNYVIKRGEVGNEMYIIGHGAVSVTLEDGHHVATLHEGQFFGESALLEESARNANVIADDYCDLYKLSKEDFLTIIKKYPELHKNIVKVIEKRKR